MALALAGCDGMPEFPALSGAGAAPADAAPAEVARQSGSFAQDPGAGQSAIIADLLSRRSLLEPGSAYDAVAGAALDASARASEADLTAARLRAEAASKNWLPTLGPSVSLTGLGDVVAQILVEQVLFDNGRRKAEREFAAADVEVAAVTLSKDMNARVETALSLYLTALRGAEKAALYRIALERMEDFARIVEGRVQGGVSDRSDLRVVRGKIADLRSARRAAEESRSAALDELQAMTGRDFDARPASLELPDPPAGATALDVLLAEATARRSLAEAKAARAGLLPGLTAQGKLTDSGTSGGLTLDLAQPFGFGTGAALKALEVARDAADRRVAEAREEARRSLGRQARRLASFRRQAAEAERLAAEAQTTFELFRAQFKAGQRSVMEVVSVYEKLVERHEARIGANYEIVLTQLAMARDLGLLADGEKI